MNEKMIAVFVNTDQLPIETKHICFYTSNSFDKIALMEVYVETYPHPDAPESANISVILHRTIREYNKSDDRAAPAILLDAAQKNCKQLLIRG